MMKRCIFLSKALSAVFASLLLIFSLMLSDAASAATLNHPILAAARLTDTLQDNLLNAGKSFLGSALDNYTKGTGKTFDQNFTTVKETVNTLAEQLERAANPNIKPAERNAIFSKINANQKSLRQLATSFNGLADETEQYNNTLADSVEHLLATVKGPVRDKFEGNRDALREISKAVSEIADNTKNVKEKDLAGLLNRVGGSITSLNQAVDIGSKTIKALSAFTG